MSMMKGIISLTIGVIMVTTVLIPQLKNVNTTGWDTTEVALLSIGSIGALVGLGYGSFAIFGLV